MAQDEEPALEAIAPGDFRSHLLRAASRALKENVWAGTLFFHAPAGKSFSSKVRISPCSTGEEDSVARIALLSLGADGAALPAEPETEAPGGSDAELRSGLVALAAACPVAPDGVMFSDIQSSRGRVEVYGVGSCFESMEWGHGMPMRERLLRISNGSGFLPSPWTIRSTASNPSTGSCLSRTRCGRISPCPFTTRKACTPCCSSPAAVPEPSIPRRKKTLPRSGNCSNRPLPAGGPRGRCIVPETKEER